MACAMMLITAASPAWAAEKVVLALGDSLTQGYGLPPEAGFVPQLEAWLRAAGAEVRVINAGVSGDTTAGGAARIGWSLSQPVDAVLVELGGNDILRGLPPEEAKANLARILRETTGRGLPTLLIGLRAPGNFGPEYKAGFDALYPALAEEFGVELVPDFLAPLFETADRQAALRDYFQPDGIHPNRQGVALVVAAIGPRVLRLIAPP